MKLTFPMPHRQHCEAANAGRGIDCYCMIYGKTEPGHGRAVVEAGHLGVRAL
jgi:hypothetical protein